MVHSSLTELEPRCPGLRVRDGDQLSEKGIAMITITTISRPSSWGFRVERDGTTTTRMESVYSQSLGRYSPSMDLVSDAFDRIVSAAEQAGEKIVFLHA
jgi:hypothetical protein